MTAYLLTKWIHILSSTLLFGTGIGTAYYLLCAVWTKNPFLIAAVGKYVIAADWLFTATTIVIQPVTGFYLIHLLSIPLTSTWIRWSLALIFTCGNLLATSCLVANKAATSGCRRQRKQTYSTRCVLALFQGMGCIGYSRVYSDGNHFLFDGCETSLTSLHRMACRTDYLRD